MPYILRIFGMGTPHILGYFAGGVPKIGGFEYPMTPGTVTLYRYYDDALHHHFYTTDRQEILSGYTSQGDAGYCYEHSTEGLVPLYCYYNSERFDHFYTTDAIEIGTIDDRKRSKEKKHTQW